jgi:diguanylate cyclase (GGDEF)-like protein
MSIVVYDHDEENLKSFKTLLEESGHLDAFTTNQLAQLKSMMGLGSDTLVQALGPAVRVQATLLIIDVDEGEVALDFLRLLKSDLRYKDIPIVVTSESDFEQNIRTAYAYGANDFIRKPLNLGETKARIHASLRLNHEIDRRKARENEITEIANQLRDLTQVLMKLSLIDPLTGVANRRAFDQTTDQEFKRAKRSKKAISILLFDVDHFKLYNDHYGHPAGDLCLRTLAQEVQSTIKRPGDMLARYGGEEFAIVLPETDVQGAFVIADRILKGIEKLGIRHEYNSVAPVVTVSVGAATFNGYVADFSAEMLVEMADKALYEAKRQGRNRQATLNTEIISPFSIEP